MIIAGCSTADDKIRLLLSTAAYAIKCDDGSYEVGGKPMGIDILRF